MSNYSEGDIEEEKLLPSELSLLKKELAVGFQPVWESSSSQLDLLPINAFEFHASWSFDPLDIQKNLDMMPGENGGGSLIVRAMDSASGHYHDYPIDGSKNKGNFSLPEGGWDLSCSLGVLSESGYFRPMLRSQSIQLPEAPCSEKEVEIQEDEFVEKDSLSIEKESFEGRAISAMKPLVDEKDFTSKVALPHWLPDELRYIPEAFEADELDAVLKEPIRSELYEEPEIPVNEVEVLGSVIEDLAKGVYRSPVSADSSSSTHFSDTASAEPELSASWSFASQSSDDFPDSNSAISIRAFLILEGGMDSSLQMVLCGKTIEPEPDGSFSYDLELKIPGQVEQLLRLATEQPPTVSNILEFSKKSSTSGAFFELNSKLRILGKVTDARYLERLSENLNLSTDGRFVVERPLPQGALFLSGIGVIPLEEKE